MRINKFLIIAILVGVAFSSCKKESFVEENIDPNTLYDIAPEEQLLAAISGSQNDFEYFYDVYRALNLWLQYSTGAAGNSPNFTNPTSNFNYRYGTFYGTVGRNLSDIPQIIAKMSTDNQARYTYLIDVAAIFKAYYAFYVSDINGSIPYTEAFAGRYGGTLEPTYDTQEDLFSLLDTQVKDAVASLKATSATGQITFNSSDAFYGSYADQIQKWIKAGNALRLKMGMRLMKRNPDKLKSIATEVLADASNQMESNQDGWVLLVGPTYANATGNYNPSTFAASKTMISFLQSKSDPRLRIFYRPNKLGNYLGSVSSPDDAKLPQYAPLYTGEDTLSQLQHRLFTPNYAYDDGVAGTGVGFFPILTYAEYCFLRADMATRNITTDNAEEWYTKGITASIDFYDERAAAAGVPSYQAVSAEEISAYLAMPGIAFDAAKAAEQIACQAYLDFFRQPMEAWAWWKRTGFPNTTSVLPWDKLTSNGAENTLPRRAPLTLKLTSDANYANQKAAYDLMAQDAGFGSGPGDGFGRVWWDVE